MKNADDGASVEQQNLPRQCSHEVGHEERQNDQCEKKVLVLPALCCDHVGERVADDDRRNR